MILWSVEDDQVLGQTLADTKENITELAFRPDRKTLVVASSSLTTDSSSYSAISEWEIATHTQLNRSTNQSLRVITSLRLLENSKLLAAGVDEHIVPSSDQAIADGSNDNKSSTFSTIQRNAVLWDGINSPQVLEQFRTHYQSSVAAVTLSRDGALLAVGLNNGKIILWDLKQWQQAGEPLLEHKIRVGPIVFSPDGALLASGSMDHQVVVFSLATRQLLGRIAVPNEEIRSLAFSEDGKVLNRTTRHSYT